RTERVVRVGDGELDRLDCDLEDVARLRAFDEYRTGQDVSARPAILDRVDDVAERRLDLIFGDAGSFEPRGRGGQQGVDADALARTDPKRGLCVRAVVPVRHRRRRRLAAFH